VLFMTHAWGPPLCALLLLTWWLVWGPVSRQARWLVAMTAVALAEAAWIAADSSIHDTLWMHGLPGAVGAAALALLVPARLPKLRVAAALVLGIAAVLPWDLVRLNGVTGAYGLDLSLRWKPTAEQAAQAYANKGAPSSGEPSQEV